MEKVHMLTDQITRLIAQIEENYPELYKQLEEIAPRFKPAAGKQPTPAELKKYYETLKQALKHFLENHKIYPNR